MLNPSESVPFYILTPHSYPLKGGWLCIRPKLIAELTIAGLQQALGTGSAKRWIGCRTCTTSVQDVQGVCNILSTLVCINIHTYTVIIYILCMYGFHLIQPARDPVLKDPVLKRRVRSGTYGNIRFVLHFQGCVQKPATAAPNVLVKTD